MTPYNLLLWHEVKRNEAIMTADALNFWPFKRVAAQYRNTAEFHSDVIQMLAEIHRNKHHE